MDTILSRIEALRRRSHGAEMARGSGRLATVLVCGLLGWLVVDYWFVTTVFGLGWWDVLARLALTGTLLWLAVREASRVLVAEIRRNRSDDELAMRLELSHPTLGGRLISAVQLTRSLAAGGRRAVGSTGLVEALAEEAEGLAGTVDPRQAWDLRHARRAVLTGAGLLLLGIGLIAWRPDIATAFLRRLVFIPAHYPTATRILAVTVPGLVGRGDPVVVEVRVDPTSDVPERASATVRGADGRTAELRLERVEVEGQAVYRGTVRQAIEDLAIRPVAGDHRWERFEEVRVQQRPAVRRLTLRLIHPAYLGLADATTEVGDLQVPAGTRVEIVAALTRQVREAALSLRSGTGEPRSVAMDLASGGTEARGAFIAEADGSWSIGLTGPEGLDAGDPPRWTLVATPDRAPSITATFPPRDKDVTRFARWPLRFTVRDDHGVAGVALRWQVVPPGADPESLTGAPAKAEIPALTTTGPAATQGEHFFDLAPLNLEPGSRVLWWLEARDARTPEANLAASQRGTFTIVDPREMSERMAREKADLLNTLKTIRDRQNEAKASVDGVIKATGTR